MRYDTLLAHENSCSFSVLAKFIVAAEELVVSASQRRDYFQL